MSDTDKKFDQWFEAQYGPEPGPALFPRDAWEWRLKRQGAWAAWVHLGICHHEGQLPFQPRHMPPQD